MAGSTLEEEMAAAASQGVEEEAPVVASLRRPVSQYRVSRLSRILKLSNFLRPKVPNPSRLLVPSELCYLRSG